MYKILLCCYQILFYLIQPLIWIYLLLRSHKNPDYRKRWLERYGYYRKKIIAGGIVLHSVSVGEALTAIPLIKKLQKYYPNISITITTMTPTGSHCIKCAFCDNSKINNIYLPYDLSRSIERFLNQVNPKLFIIMETELWPNLINSLYKRNIPLVIANARLSERSAKKYKKISKFIYHIFNRITLIAAQYQKDKDRFISLGVKKSKIIITGNLKSDISITSELLSQCTILRNKWARNRQVWIASSTHNGEESILLSAHQKLLKKYPNLLFILVPRHPERFSFVISLVKKFGFNYILRSTNHIPSSHTQVIIGDTIGELNLLYGISDLAFIGGSLVNHGGHNPFEATIYNIPIIMGPYIFNFDNIFTSSSNSKALITITNEELLIKKIEILLTNKDYRQYYCNHIIKILSKNTKGVLEQLLALLKFYL
ncbi:3-deoxy-D-manno-octulosonic acid transferase [Candidatus Ecksteinia adelgidicola]|nr:3-deoxy-D-manno-octulosonic acid transferase [Candidatus Ecksteinia adelgidicola]